MNETVRMQLYIMVVNLKRIPKCYYNDVTHFLILKSSKY